MHGDGDLVTDVEEVVVVNSKTTELEDKRSEDTKPPPVIARDLQADERFRAFMFTMCSSEIA